MCVFLIQSHSLSFTSYLTRAGGLEQSELKDQAQWLRLALSVAVTRGELGLLSLDRVDASLERKCLEQAIRMQ